MGGGVALLAGAAGVGLAYFDWSAGLAPAAEAAVPAAGVAAAFSAASFWSIISFLL